ncbi:condensation domain-containing protein [Actinomadura fulvescens]|uniref:Carrier domain-containing protein n=1 Tax=Actinomadura fulvescens TaxID=46160 RepID=A0ABN3QTP3_9ACTN
MTEVRLPTSFAQERLWLVDQVDPGSAYYNMANGMRLRGELDLTALQRALDTIVARHEALRTTFDSHQGRPVQVVGPPFSIAIDVDDLSALDAAGRSRAVREAAEREAGKPVDLRRGPMLWCRLLRLDETDHVLVLTFHNIVMDAWSTVNFHREFAHCYEAATRGEPPALPELPVQYTDFAVWQRETFTEEVLAGQLDYWRTQLSGAPPALELPADRVRPAHMTHAAAAYPLRLPDEPVRRVRKVARAEGATMHMTLLAALAVTLSRYSGTDDLMIGTPVSNRPDAALEPLIGCFLNTLVLRVDLGGSPTFRQVVGRARETTIDALANQDLSFAQVVAAVGAEREANRFPLTSVSFQVLDGRRWRALDHPELPGLVTTAENVFCKTRFDLEFQLLERPDGTIDGELIASTELFEDATVDRVIEDFGDVVEAVAAAPDQPLTEVVGRLAGDRRTFAAATATRASSYTPRFPTLRSAVEHWSRERPDAVAVMQPGTFADASLTYRDLADEAARLTAVLESLPAGGDHVVTVECPAAPGVVSGALAIIEDGGTALWSPAPTGNSGHLLRPGHAINELAVTDHARLEDARADDAGAVKARADDTGADDTGAGADDARTDDGGADDTRAGAEDTGAVADDAGGGRAGGDDAGCDGAGCDGAGGASRAFGGVAFAVPVGEGTVQLTDGALATGVGAGVAELPAEPGRVWALLDPIQTEVGLLAVYAALISGERLVAVPPALQRSPELVEDLLAGEQAICLIARASTLSRFDTAIGGLGRLPVTTVVLWDDDPAAADALAGGDQDGGRAPHLLAIWPTVEVPWGLSRRPQAAGGPPAYRAGPGVAPLVLTESLERCPVLAVGDLYLSADHLNVGYYGDSTATVRRPDPFMPAGAWMLATGRSARLLPDGRVRLTTGGAGEEARSASAPAAQSPSDTDAAPAALQRLVTDVWGEVLGIRDVDPETSFFALGGHSLLAAQVVARLRSALGWDVPLAAVFKAPTVRGLTALLAAIDPGRPGPDDHPDGASGAL